MVSILMLNAERSLEKGDGDLEVWGSGCRTRRRREVAHISLACPFAGLCLQCLWVALVLQVGLVVQISRC